MTHNSITQPLSAGAEDGGRFSLSKLLIGRPLETEQLAHQTVTRIIGLAVFASDALSSTAYATEEILIILALSSVALSTLSLSLPIALTIAVLLTIVTISYRQTIHAYPNGGGAYIVARDNLGELPAQVAGAALLTDYILTVAVSVSAGVAQITSGIPDLLPYRVTMALAVIGFITLVNLRGVKESGRLFAIPTYFFLAMMVLTLGLGFFRYATGNLPTVEDVEVIHVETAQALTLFLVLRAFSSGCTALTGIEAISNGITAFKQPRSHNAAVTLTWMSGILISLFLGITFLAHEIHAMPSESETVISQMARTVHGDASIMYGLTLLGTTAILLMAANTSYADFPRLAALHAGDGFLPRQLTNRGSRLVFAWGIMVLAGCAALLVVIADARTTTLIPLYAVGVFLSFTVSQTGMVVRARKIGKLKPGEVVKGLETELRYDPQWRLHMFISGLGAVSTGIVMVVFAVTQFLSGAWFVVILIPTLVFIFFRIHHHYKRVAYALSMQTTLITVRTRPVETLILVDDVHNETVRLVNFAKSLCNSWRAIHIAVKPEKVPIVLQKWQERIGDAGTLEIIPSPYRHLAAPIREFIENEILAKNPDTFVHVVMGHLVMDTFWEQALHQNSAYIFNIALAGLEQVVVTRVPYQIHRQHHEYVPETQHDGTENQPTDAAPHEESNKPPAE